MGSFDLPSKWVFVEFENGDSQNVASQSSLSQKEADWFKDYWASRGTVTAVVLQDSKGNEIKRFKY